MNGNGTTTDPYDTPDRPPHVRPPCAAELRRRHLLLESEEETDDSIFLLLIFARDEGESAALAALGRKRGRILAHVAHQLHCGADLTEAKQLVAADPRVGTSVQAIDRLFSDLRKAAQHSAA